MQEITSDEVFINIISARKSITNISAQIETLKLQKELKEKELDAYLRQVEQSLIDKGKNLDTEEK